ncbi:tyrosine--tRNA ligase [Patescibacteria group bacterium]|nr:tyrosine--tRNA ligase [Patescibacteria group bacterium]MBU1074953.1 tyrosine--tRNA ligase [Patescibacteria group bacterium]MBU1952509.1 tyrosine--tRNA ligase [Patescibacteria group bacterium]
MFNPFYAVKVNKKELYQELLTRGVDEIVVEKDLKKKLSSGKKLRVKHGVDPTTTDLHLGYAVVYEKLRQFQELGHIIVFLIGDFTARFGDPTDQKESRTLRSKDETTKTAKNYIEQLGKILDIGKVEVRYNGEWGDKMSAEDLIHLVSKFTVARMLERDMFKNRIKEGREIGYHEPIYPILQGYDSVMLKSDVTVIGTDQKFNELQARPLQQEAGQPPQDLMMMPLLVGTDGKRKMSQSLGNYIGLTEPANEQYGKIMSIPDELLIPYFTSITRVSLEEIEEIGKELKGGLNPKDVKKKLAREIVTIYHSKNDAIEAEKEFENIFKNKQKPSNIPAAKLKVGEYLIPDLLVELKMASSKSEARRLVEQGGIRIDEQVKKEWKQKVKVKKGTLIQVGKKKFIEIK